MRIEFVVEVEPVPQARPRFSRGRCYEPARCAEFKEKIRQSALIAMDGQTPTASPLSCAVKFYRKYKSTSRRFGDCDNLYKAVTDAMNGIVYIDDSQIVNSNIAKLTDKDRPRVDGLIEEMSTTPT